MPENTCTTCQEARVGDDDVSCERCEAALENSVSLFDRHEDGEECSRGRE